MSENHTEEHSSPIKTPKQLITVIVLSFVVPIGLIIMLSQLLTTGLKTSDKSAALNAESVAARLKPVGQGSGRSGVCGLPQQRRLGRAENRRQGGLGFAHRARS